MEIEQLCYSNLPTKRPQLGNPSTRPAHPEGLGSIVTSPWSSKFALVPSRTPLDLQVNFHQDLAHVLDWEHTF